MRTRSVPAMLVALITLATLPLAGAGQSMDLWAGAWALNVEKSKYNAGPPPDPKFANATVVLSIVDGQLRITSGPENARWVNVVRFDGKEHRIMGPAQPTTRVYTWIDDRTYEWVQRVRGKVTTTTRLVLSPDGKTHTLTTTGVDEKGERIDRMTVYRKAVSAGSPRRALVTRPATRRRPQSRAPPWPP